MASSSGGGSGPPSQPDVPGRTQYPPESGSFRHLPGTSGVRQVATIEQRRILDPYTRKKPFRKLRYEEQRWLIEATGMEESRIVTYFQNARARENRKRKEESSRNAVDVPIPPEHSFSDEARSPSVLSASSVRSSQSPANATDVELQRLGPEGAGTIYSPSDNTANTFTPGPLPSQPLHSPHPRLHPQLVRHLGAVASGESLPRVPLVPSPPYQATEHPYDNPPAGSSAVHSSNDTHHGAGHLTMSGASVMPTYPFAPSHGLERIASPFFASQPSRHYPSASRPPATLGPSYFPQAQQYQHPTGQHPITGPASAPTAMQPQTYGYYDNVGRGQAAGTSWTSRASSPASLRDSGGEQPGHVWTSSREGQAALDTMAQQGIGGENDYSSQSRGVAWQGEAVGEEVAGKQIVHEQSPGNMYRGS